MSNKTLEAEQELIVNEAREKVFGDVVFSDFMSMSEDEKNAFKEKMEKAHGTVQIWIHSHYDEHKDTSEDAEPYKKSRQKAFGSLNTDVMPVISFIEAPPGFEYNIDAYGREYAKILKGKVYIVPTFQNFSVPCFVNTEDTLVSRHATEVTNWDIVGQRLASLDVKNVILQGRNFEYTNVPTEKLTLAQEIFTSQNKFPDAEVVNLPDKCAGSAVVQLAARGFNMLPSTVTFPEKLR